MTSKYRNMDILMCTERKGKQLRSPKKMTHKNPSVYRQNNYLFVVFYYEDRTTEVLATHCFNPLQGYCATTKGSRKYREIIDSLTAGQVTVDPYNSVMHLDLSHLQARRLASLEALSVMSMYHDRFQLDHELCLMNEIAASCCKSNKPKKSSRKDSLETLANWAVFVEILENLMSNK
jgi:hypothetical protein